MVDFIHFLSHFDLAILSIAISVTFDIKDEGTVVPSIREEKSSHNQDLVMIRVHHTAIICSDYEKSKHFYTEILGLTIIQEVYREARQSYKLDLALNGVYVIELFSFPNPPKRVSRPEAAGLRHISFEVDNIYEMSEKISKHGVIVEPIRTDEFTNQRYTFFPDPDDLPIELYERAQ